MAPHQLAHQEDTEILVSQPHWVQAHIDRSQRTLTVYRSVLLAEDDPWLDPVVPHLERAKLVKLAIVSDPDMFFGQAEHSLYLLEA